MKNSSIWKRVILIAACMALVLSMAACGNEPADSGTSSGSSSSESSVSSGSDAEVSSGNEAPAEGSLPLVTEPTTLKFWFAGLDAMVTDYNQSEYYQWLEDQTGVHIEWTIPVSGTETESFNLLFASGDVHDFIQNQSLYGRAYSSGPDMAISDGVYLRLNDYESLMPNYLAIVNADPQLQKDTVTDSGNRWCFNYLYAEGGRKGNMGPAVRKDFLDAVNLDVPVTFDDWHEVLTAFKEQLNIEIPLFYSSGDNDGTTGYSEFMAGFGIGRDFYLDDGTVKYGPMEDAYEDYLNMMKQWYSEGLIDQSFSTRGGQIDDDLILNDKIGAIGITYATFCGDTYYPSRGAANPDFNLVGAPIPVQKEGDVTHLRNPDIICNALEIAISAESKNPELAVRWMDYQYGPDADKASNYGVREGETFIDNGDGTYSWGPDITANADGLTQNQARTLFTTLNAPYEHYSRVMGAWTEDQLNAQKTWTASPCDGILSTALTLSEEEGEERSNIMGDIKTFVAEYNVNTIMGQSTQSFEDFRSQLQSMKIDRAIEITQAAVDRYNAR